RREIEELKIRQAQAHYAGMAEVATNVLHNLGNVCTSVIFAAESLLRAAERSSVGGLARANELLAANLDRLGEFFAEDPKAKTLARYYLRLGEALAGEARESVEGGRDLLRKAHLMKDAIAAQQAYARGSDFVEPVDVGRVVDDVLQLQRASLERHGVSVVSRVPEGSVLRAQRSKLTHVLINLVKNAREAVNDLPPERRVVTLDLVDGEGTACLRVSDEGVGICPEDLTKIFTHGFSTKPEGHGFGLHFCATAMIEMGGKLAVESAGPGKGATFSLVLRKPEGGAG
ncbi:MAG TPA: sensor histidine kinase, partial [Polyangiaceae bacterium]|nr:sensor histidine kinase [Polyangiaceae bacterium]